MGYGDEVLAAGQAQRAYDGDPQHKRVVICDTQGRPRWHPIWEGNPVILHPDEFATGGYPYQSLISGPHCRPYIVYPFDEQTGWTFNRSFRARDYPAKIYLTPAEIAVARAVFDRLGPFLLVEPFTKHTNLRWPLDRWQAVVDGLTTTLAVVQHVHRASPSLHGVAAVLATFREACALAAVADVYARSESGLCHAAAAFGVPQVTIWGGCLDWSVLGGYPFQIGLVDHGPDSPCGRWLPCDHCRQALDRITVDGVVQAIRRALDGDFAMDGTG